MNMIFKKSPNLKFAANTFVNTPIILQYEDTPLLQITKQTYAKCLGFTTQIQIYNCDGIYLGKIEGNRTLLTDEGEKENIEIFDNPESFRCTLDGKSLFELYYDSADFIRAEAELYTPDGHLLKCQDYSMPNLFSSNGHIIDVKGIKVSGIIFDSWPIGIWFGQDGTYEFAKF